MTDEVRDGRWSGVLAIPPHITARAVLTVEWDDRRSWRVEAELDAEAGHRFIGVPAFDVRFRTEAGDIYAGQVLLTGLSAGPLAAPEATLLGVGPLVREPTP